MIVRRSSSSQQQPAAARAAAAAPLLLLLLAPPHLPIPFLLLFHQPLKKNMVKVIEDVEELTSDEESDDEYEDDGIKVLIFYAYVCVMKDLILPGSYFCLGKLYQ